TGGRARSGRRPGDRTGYGRTRHGGAGRTDSQAGGGHERLLRTTAAAAGWPGAAPLVPSPHHRPVRATSPTRTYGRRGTTHRAAARLPRPRPHPTRRAAPPGLCPLFTTRPVAASSLRTIRHPARRISRRAEPPRR